MSVLIWKIPVSVSGVGYAVEMGEAIERDKNGHLVDRFLSFLRAATSWTAGGTIME